jgi:hypothetical protein
MSSESSYELPHPLDIQATFEASRQLDFCLPGLLCGSVEKIVGPSSIGKSFLVMEIAALIAAGADIDNIYGPRRLDWSCISPLKTPGKSEYEQSALAIFQRLHPGRCRSGYPGDAPLFNITKEGTNEYA